MCPYWLVLDSVAVPGPPIGWTAAQVLSYVLCVTGIYAVFVVQL
jgi:hypothetical protein